MYYYPHNFILAFVSSLAFALLILPRLTRAAEKLGLVDHPNRRKVHSSPKPLVGGLGIMMAVSLASLMFVPLMDLRGFYAGLILIALVGLLDDFSEISPRVRFLAQICAVLLLVYYSDTRLKNFGNLLSYGQITFGRFEVVATVFCLVGVINAINMIDGLDGLAGGTVLAAFAAFGTLAFLNAQFGLFTLSMAFCGALTGFLWYNRPPARLFMGDAGSIALGLALGYYSIKITHHPGGIAPPVCALLIMAVPITDTLLVMGMRLRLHKSPFRPDKRHFHHLLVRFGYTKEAAVLIIVSLTAGFGIFSVLGAVLALPEYLMFGVYMAYFILCLALSLNMKRLYRARLEGRLPLPFAGARNPGREGRAYSGHIVGERDGRE